MSKTNKVESLMAYTIISVIRELTASGLMAYYFHEDYETTPP